MTESTRQIPFGRPMLGDAEVQAVLEVLAGPILVHGPKATEFEEAFAKWTGASHAVSLSSCTAALHLSYFYLGIGPGDEVIVPAQTHTATVHAVELTGATPVFVDAEPQTGNIDLTQIEDKITDKTRAISLVHFLGIPVDMERLGAIAKNHDLFVVEDCALAVGSYFKGVHVGLHGDTGCFSFYPVKHMTTAEGGMLLTKHPQVKERIKRQKAFGVDRTPTERAVPGVYDVNMLGFNYRLNEIQSAIGIEQIKRLSDFLKSRERHARMLREELDGIEGISYFAPPNEDHVSSNYCFQVVLDETLRKKRYEIVSYLKTRGVGTTVHYPHPVPRLSYYREKYGYVRGMYPVAESISDGSIALPVGPHLQDDDIEWIVTTFRQAIDVVRSDKE